ncbi:MAG: ABC transporter ATP-binding protein, partial [Gemmatimonadetes bacterium]|nr:ABC transporter ATP-binding protein [Gemmatimonadota bacterium]
MIVLDGVSKTYRSLLGRRVQAVQEVSLGIAAGEVVGIAGPNGAGKSTLISLLLGFVAPTAGRVRIGGLPPRDFVERHGIAYVPELMALPPSWTVQDALRRLATLSGVRADRLRGEVDRVIDALAIGEHRDKRIKALSKGNYQRLGIAQALLLDSPVVIFDEPTHGLDPVWTLKFRDLVRALRRADRAIVIASHNLDELERLADRVVIVDQGRVQRVVTVRAGDASERTPYRVRVATGAAAMCAHLAGATIAANGDVDVPAVDLATLNAGLAAAIADG